MSVNWQRTSYGFEAIVGEGVLRLTVFYEHAWKVGINDRVMRHEYPDPETCKRVAVNWSREKLRIMESELRELERVATPSGKQPGGSK